MRKLITAFAFSAMLTAVPAAAIAAESDEETFRQLELFGDIFERVRSQYVDETTDNELIESAINGMLQALDPHSSYLNEESFRDMQVQTRGEFGGLGIEVTMEQGLVRVVSPIDDTPAARAGIEAGDFITHLDGETVLGLTLSEAVDKMRGRIGSDIRLTIRREGQEAFDVSVTRDVVRIKSVRSRVEGKVGYVRITTFNEQTNDGLETAMADIKEKLGDDMIGLVLDLRRNPGGLLDQAVKVSDAFLDRGEIVSTRGRDKDDSQRFNARPGDLANGQRCTAARVAVVFDGTELGQLQRGFNSMAAGLRERERVRDLFGRHVGREVAALAEKERPELGGEDRYAAVVFVDIIGSTKLVTSRPAGEVVELLNRFFAVIVEEVDRHHGLVNKFEGDAVLAVFGAPVSLEHPEDESLAAASERQLTDGRRLSISSWPVTNVTDDPAERWVTGIPA